MKDQKKILFIIDHLKGGGAEIMTLNLAKKLQERGYEIHILLLENHNNFKNRTESFHLYSLNTTSGFVGGKLLINKSLNQETINRLDSLILEIQPSNIIITIWYAFLVLPYIKHKNILTWFQADLLPPFKKTYNPIKFLRNHYKNIIFKRKFISLFSNRKIITLNQDLRKKYASLLNNPDIQVIPNGIPQPLDLNSLEKGWDICFVGRLSPSKQVEHAILAFSNSILTGRMVIVGEGPRRSKLEKLALKLGILDRIDFIGWVNNTETYIKKSKLLILPSLTEGYPLVIGESLQNKTPVIAYNCSEGVASQFYTDDMQRGLVQLNDIHALELAMNDLIKEPYSIPEDIYLRYSLDTMADRFINLLD